MLHRQVINVTLDNAISSNDVKLSQLGSLQRLRLLKGKKYERRVKVSSLPLPSPRAAVCLAHFDQVDSLEQVDWNNINLYIPISHLTLRLGSCILSLTTLEAGSEFQVKSNSNSNGNDIDIDNGLAKYTNVKRLRARST